ncbi:MAG: glycosyltransferase [Candidatus Gastranaerophilales bacterium]|nr:glycosyltransferase [Candidatus Gastranaerophilales bacterium]
MKILIIARGYPVSRKKPYGIFEFDQATALARAGHEVFYLSLDIRSIRRVRRLGTYELKKEGVLIHNTSFPCGRVPERIKEYVARRILRKQYQVLVNKYGNPDIIHAHFLEYGYYAVKELKKTGIPIIITEHSSQISEDVLTKAVYRMGKGCYREADKLICVSTALAKRIADQFGVRNSVVVPNIVDTEIFRYEEKKRSVDCFTFACVASLIPLKRIAFLVEVFADVVKMFPKIQLIIVGDGSEKKRIKRVIVEHGIDDKVFLAGQQKREAIKHIFDKSDCFILPSSSETFGVAYIEAMASGLPVIATKCGGPEDFVDDSNGILVEVDNKTELYEAMVEMIQNRHKYDSRRIATDITERFSGSKIASQIVMEYRKVRR